jgi:AAA domain
VERDVIVLSLTRADEKFVTTDMASRAGVFNQVKRTNVSLTRAEHLFIVVGNPNLMVKDLIWRQWLWFCLRNGVWYGEQVDHAWLDEMQVKPINLEPFRNGETHALLATSSHEMENSVLVSSMERNQRFL